MQTVIQLATICLQVSSVYILFSLGLTLVYGVMGIVNFAHGQIFALSALIVAVTIPPLASAGFSVLTAYTLASLLGFVVAVTAGILVYIFFLRFFWSDHNGSFILTIGIVLFTDGVLLALFGGNVRQVPDVFNGDAISVFGARVASQRLIPCAVAIVATLVLYLALARTKLGLALRAVAADHEAAMLQGIPYARIAFLGFVIATALAAIAGAVIAPLAAVSPNLGADYIIRGFIAVILGGLGSVSGAILGSIFIAVIETVGGFYFDASSANILIFVLVILVLLLRPRGLLGHA